MTIKNWDGSALSANEPLFIRPGQTLSLKLDLTPADADSSTIKLSMTMEPEDSEPPYMPIGFNNEGFTITGYREAVRTLRIFDADYNDALASVDIVCTTHDYLLYGVQCGDNVVCSLTDDGVLAFWAGKVGVGRYDKQDGASYTMWDFAEVYTEGSTVEPAPWARYAGQIRSLNLNNLDNIGTNAFRNMTNLRYVTLPSEIMSIGGNAFVGCTNLTTLDVRRTDPPTISEVSLQIDAQGTPVPVVIVPYVGQAQDPYIALTQYLQDGMWNVNGRTITVDHAEGGAIEWSLTESDTLQSLQLHVGQSFGSPAVLGDRDDLATYPWDNVGGYVEDLVIDDNVSYIGKGVFRDLGRLQTIQFHSWNHPLDSIHAEAFSSDCAPWKFAFGDPQDGPVRPPKVIGFTQDMLQMLDNFMQNTVLYVPDSLVDDGKGGKIKCVELYKNDPFWGIFNRITDRTVAVTEDANKMIFKWLPLENAKGYELSFHKVGCEKCNASITIPATGVQGLIDWAHFGAIVPGGDAPYRAPKSDDNSGGMTLTISIKTGSGAAHNQDVEAEVSGFEPEADYTYSREVFGKTSVNKEGAFKAPAATAVEEVSEEPRAKSQKFFRNGQLYIIRDGKTYNAFGVMIKD